MNHLTNMLHAVKLAVHNVENRRGKPYGAVIVKDGKAIGSGTNDVLATLDPTAHAEIQAVRHACRELQTDRLDGAVLYVSAEPCAMCLAAMYWAGIREVYYGYSAEEAAAFGFDYRMISKEMALPASQRAVMITRLPPADDEANPFEVWRHLHSLPWS
jgi:guanine deaminase